MFLFQNSNDKIFFKFYYEIIYFMDNSTYIQSKFHLKPLKF